ncbi:MAG: hypothetical protein AB7H97_10370, partial [Pseudobdellovibrionaceae bacterium]
DATADRIAFCALDIHGATPATMTKKMVGAAGIEPVTSDTSCRLEKQRKVDNCFIARERCAIITLNEVPGGKLV